MSITGGVFSETILANIQLKAEQYWQDRIQKQDYVADAEVIKVLNAKQTATFGNFLTGKKKDPTVEISWINACDIDDRACHNCTFPTTELSTNMEEKTLTQCRETGFAVNEHDFHDNVYDFENIVAKGLLTAGKVLDEWWAGRGVVAMNAAKGVNAAGTVSKGVVSGTDTYVLPAYWDAGLMSYFAMVSEINKFNNEFLISGKNLYESVWTADYETCCEEDRLKFGSLPIYFDLVNIDIANTPDYVTYMIHGGAFAYYTKAYYTGVPVKYMDQWRWAVPSRNIPGVMYDVHYMNECNTNDDFFTHYWKFKTLGDIYVNPTGCTATRTGLLSFICGAPDE